MRQDLRSAQKKAGFWKIERTCEQAKVENLEYAWVDTVCIDKTSSAELQEAINSMFDWYSRCARCYAYIADASADRTEEPAWLKSRWFTRGWTLQELIAPREIFFYDLEWKYLGLRSNLYSKLAKRTGIDSTLLSKPDAVNHVKNNSNRLRRTLNRYSIAQRMSWAAERSTTRVEDRAYSLLGLFGVNMPLLYGEGQNAFLRLQQEILRSNSHSDLSILLWERVNVKHGEEGLSQGRLGHTLFAASPDAFATCSTLHHHTSPGSPQSMEDNLDMTVSGNSIRTWARVMPIHINDHEPADLVALFDCYSEADITTTIALKLISHTGYMFAQSASKGSSEASGLLVARPYSVDTIGPHKPDARTISLDVLQSYEKAIRRQILLTAQDDMSTRYTDNRNHISDPESVWFRFTPRQPLDPAWHVLCAWPPASWNLSRMTFDTADSRAYQKHGWNCGAIAFERTDVIMSRVIVTFVEDGRVPPGFEEHSRSLMRSKDRLLFKIYQLHDDEPVRPRTLTRYLEQFIDEDLTGNQREAFAQTQQLVLYDGTGVYEGAAFIITPDLHRFMLGRRLRVMRCSYSTLPCATEKEKRTASELPLR